MSPFIVLASSSPRRFDLLRTSGYEVSARAPAVDESWNDSEAVDEYVLRMAREKCQAVAQQLKAENIAFDLIIAADTVCTIDGEMLGKPGNPETAREFLTRLSGRKHTVTSGYAVGRGDELKSGQVSSTVTFRKLTAAAIENYIATLEPLDKAGGYGIQGLGAALIQCVDGSFTNVVGLPLDEVEAAIEALSESS